MTIDGATGMVPAGTKLCGEWVVERHNRTELLVEVYQVRSPRQGRSVARILGVGGAQAEGFLKALRSLRGVEHKALAPVAAAAKEPCGVVVVSGTPEAATLRELWQRGGRMKASEVGRMVTEVSLALESLHGNVPSVVHRALCPEVIALAVQPARVWLDAWWVAHCVVEAGILPQEFPLAAPEYRAPDDLLGRVHTRSDTFALASVAFEALTGVLAFEPTTSEARILHGERPSVCALRPELLPELDAVLERAWSQEQPFANPIAFARELSRVVGSSTGSQPGILSPTAARSRAAHMDLTRPVVTLPLPEAIAPMGGGLHNHPTRQLQAPPRVEALQSDEMPDEDEVDRAFDAMLDSTERRDSQGGPAPGAAPLTRTAQTAQTTSTPQFGDAELVPPVPGTRASRPPTSSVPPSPLRSIRPTLVSGVPPRPSGVKPAPPPLPVGMTTAKHKAVAPPSTQARGPAEVELVEAEEDLPEGPPSSPVVPSEALRQALDATDPAPRAVSTEGLGATQKVLVPKLRPPPVAPQSAARNPDESDRWASMSGPGLAPVSPSTAPPRPEVPADRSPPKASAVVEDASQDRWEAPPTAPHGTDVSRSVPTAPSMKPLGVPTSQGAPLPPPQASPREPVAPPRRTPEPSVHHRAPEGRTTAPDGTQALPAAPLAPAAAIQGPPLTPAVSVPRPVPSPVAVVPAPLPSDDPLVVRVARIVGTSIVLASLIVTAGQIYLSRQVPPPNGPPAVARMSVGSSLPTSEPPPAVVVPPPPSTVETDAAGGFPALAATDAATPTLAPDGWVATPEASAQNVEPALPTATDAGRTAVVPDVASPTPTAAPPAPAVEPTGVLPSPTSAPPTPAVAPPTPPGEGGPDAAAPVNPATLEDDHPRARDIIRVTNSLRSRVRTCIAGRRTRRHVRILAEYEGATGSPVAVRLVGGYADPPVGPCIEAAVRTFTYSPFRETRWTQSYVYDLGE